MLLTFTHNLLIYLLFYLPLLCDNLCCSFVLYTPMNGYIISPRFDGVQIKLLLLLTLLMPPYFLLNLSVSSLTGVECVAGFYHQAIMMSGSDLSSIAYIRPTWRPREYAIRLAKLLDCPTHHSYDLVTCLRDDIKHPWHEFVDTQELVYPHVSDAVVVRGWFTW